jgi:RNA polymerase sigma factor (sigma-70 family)
LRERGLWLRQRDDHRVHLPAVRLQVDLPVRRRVRVRREVARVMTMTPTEELAATLVASHRDFLAFVERRVHDRALAEEIVQDALVRSLDHAGEIRESAVGWFYRVLRNSIIDRSRRAAVQAARLESLAAELETAREDHELEAVVCRCVGTLAATLKPEYADALRRIDIDGMRVNQYAEATGISASNASVRVFRARKALREQVARACGTCATHGCIDCTCGST